MLEWYPMYRYIRQVFLLKIEKSAIEELIPYIEEKINEVIFEIIKELKKINELKLKYHIH
jgi:hypothetical protein